MPIVERAQLAQIDDTHIPLDHADVNDLVVGSFPDVFDPAEQRW
jgi:hypothetical protein